MQDLPILPYGVSNFSKIIKNHLLYVDKTDLVYKLASQFAPIVLSRPRRFGKSLLVSTFEALFNGQKELFKGLKIYDLWQDDNKYKVISLEAFVNIFETILNSTSYGSKFFEDENTLRDLIYLIFVDKGLSCSVEKYHAKGRCDLCIETDEDRFVFEFKISRDDSGADEKLNEALQQIEDKAYGKILPPKNLYRFAVVFSKDQKAVIKSKSLEPILLNS